MYWERMYNSTLFVSVDMESDGPTPYRNNLLSLGAVAYVTDTFVANSRWGLKCRGLRRLSSFFSENIRPQKGAMPDENTMKNFWFKDEHHMALYQATQDRQVPIEEGMARLVRWLEDIRNMANSPSEVVPVARPGAFDFRWFSDAFAMAGVENPFGNTGVDMQSYLMGLRHGQHYRDAKASTWKDSWANPRYPHTHIAVEDAAAQGEVFRSMYEEGINRWPRSYLALRKLRKRRLLGYED